MSVSRGLSVRFQSQEDAALSLQLGSRDGVGKVTSLKFQSGVRNRSDVPWPFLG